MGRTARHDSRGMTLIEVLIALVLFLIVALGMLQSSLLSIEQNVKNSLRDEAVRIADETMVEARNASFKDLVATSSDVVTVTVGEKTDYNFNVTRTVKSLDTEDNSRQVDVEVTWNWKGIPTSHRVSTIVRRAT